MNLNECAKKLGWNWNSAVLSKSYEIPLDVPHQNCLSYTFSRDRPICDAYTESLVYYSCHKLTKLLKRFLSSHKLCIRSEKYPGKHTGDDEFYFPLWNSFIHTHKEHIALSVCVCNNSSLLRFYHIQHPLSSTSSSPTLF